MQNGNAAPRLSGFGISLFAIGLVLVAIVWFGRPSCAVPDAYEGIASLEQQARIECVQAETAWLKWSNWVNWAAEKLIAGGFLMWLAGLVITNLRQTPAESD